MRKIIKTEKAPAPIGPYNQAVQAGNSLYVSGQIALNAETGELETKNIMAETERVMLNLQAVLQAAGFDFADVVKCSIFIKDMQQFHAINAEYARFFDEKNAPARETVQVAALPKNVNVEISAIAVKA